MSVKKYNRLIDIMRKGYNNETRDELLKVRYFSVKTAIKELSRCIEDTKRNGKKIRKERQAVMIKVLEIFYTYLHKSKTGQVNPSMRTLAFLVNPELKKPNRFDNEMDLKIKERAIHAVEMSIQRAIKTLQEIGMIKVHQYYVSEKHYLSKKKACYFYELTPLSCYSRLYIDTEEDKHGNRSEFKSLYVEVPGRGSKNIVIPKSYNVKEERRKRKEAKIYKAQLDEHFRKEQEIYDRILASYNDPNAKRVGTLTQILERRKLQSEEVIQC